MHHGHDPRVNVFLEIETEDSESWCGAGWSAQICVTFAYKPFMIIPPILIGSIIVVGVLSQETSWKVNCLQKQMKEESIPLKRS